MVKELRGSKDLKDIYVYIYIYILQRIICRRDSGVGVVSSFEESDNEPGPKIFKEWGAECSELRCSRPSVI